MVVGWPRGHQVPEPSVRGSALSGWCLKYPCMSPSRPLWTPALGLNWQRVTKEVCSGFQMVYILTAMSERRKDHHRGPVGAIIL